MKYEEAVDFLRDKNLGTQRLYKKYVKDNRINLPISPHLVYKKDWIGFNEYLGNNNIITKYVGINFINFNDAKNYIKQFNIKSQREYYRWHKENKPINLPFNPKKSYSDWISWMDWLSIDKKSNREIRGSFLNFEEARKFVHKLNIKSTVEWKIYIKNKPNFIPSLPYVTYKNKWVSWEDWIGYKLNIYESMNVRIISDFLDMRNIKYIKEKRFNDCRNILPLPFDFYLPNENICIEYDGEQHFNEVKIFGGKKSFEKIKINDKIKNKYCIDKNINLIGIPYWETDVNQTLNKLIKNKLNYAII